MVTLLHARAGLKLTGNLVRRVSTDFAFSEHNNLALRVVRSHRHLIMYHVNANKSVICVRHVNSRPCQSKRVISRDGVHNRYRGYFQLPNLIQHLNARNQFPVTGHVPASNASRAANRIQRSFSVQHFRYFRHDVHSFRRVTFNERTYKGLARPVNLTIIKARLDRKVRASRTMSIPHTTGFHKFGGRYTKASYDGTFVRSSEDRQVDRGSTRGQGRAVSLVDRFIRLFTAQPNNTPLRYLCTTFARH